MSRRIGIGVLVAALLEAPCAAHAARGNEPRASATVTGHVSVLAANGSRGDGIAGVTMSFVREDAGESQTTTTGAEGAYSISLAAGRWLVLAAHRDYEDSWSAPGVIDLADAAAKTLDVALREPSVTTVLVVRHAEKGEPAQDDRLTPLSKPGQERALRLKEVLLRAGVSAIYSTDYARTRGTVEELRTALGLRTENYTDHDELARRVRERHLGDVVLVAAHSNTVAAVANALGAHVPAATIDDFDNLYVVSFVGGDTNVVNLQYGDDSQPDLLKNDGVAATFLLFGNSQEADARALIHATAKAGIVAVHANGDRLARPLSDALDKQPSSYVSTDIHALVSKLLAEHPLEPVAVAGSHADLRAVLRELDGWPLPALLDADVDHLILVTRFSSRAVRTLPLRF